MSLSKHLKRLGTVLAAIALASSLASCSNSSDEATTSEGDYDVDSFILETLNPEPFKTNNGSVQHAHIVCVHTEAFLYLRGGGNGGIVVERYPERDDSCEEALTGQ